MNIILPVALKKTLLNLAATMKSLRRLLNSRVSDSKSIDVLAEKDAQYIGEAKSSGTKGIGDFDLTIASQNVVCKSYERLDIEILTDIMVS